MPAPPNTHETNMQYRRFYRQGSLYFFTVVTYQRRPILTNPDVMPVLKTALKTVRQKYPFKIEALVILPDHLHTIGKCPPTMPIFQHAGTKSSVMSAIIAGITTALKNRQRGQKASKQHLAAAVLGALHTR